MIHSLAGGNIGKVSYFNYAKVKIIEGENSGKILWFICKIPLVEAGDIVTVEVFGEPAPVKAEIVRIDKSVASNCAPVPPHRAKEIISVVKKCAK